VDIKVFYNGHAGPTKHADPQVPVLRYQVFVSFVRNLQASYTAMLPREAG